MPSKYTICHHPACREIRTAISAGESRQTVAARWAGSPDGEDQHTAHTDGSHADIGRVEPCGKIDFGTLPGGPGYGDARPVPIWPGPSEPYVPRPEPHAVAARLEFLDIGTGLVRLRVLADGEITDRYIAMTILPEQFAAFGKLVYDGNRVAVLAVTFAGYRVSGLRRAGVQYDLAGRVLGSE